MATSEGGTEYGGDRCRPFIAHEGGRYRAACGCGWKAGAAFITATIAARVWAQHLRRELRLAPSYQDGPE